MLNRIPAGAWSLMLMTLMIAVVIMSHGVVDWPLVVFLLPAVFYACASIFITYGPWESPGDDPGMEFDGDCPGREDGRPHCSHWFDGEACCACGDPALPTAEDLERYPAFPYASHETSDLCDHPAAEAFTKRNF